MFIVFRNSHEHRKTCTRADKYSFKSLVLDQLIDGCGFTDNNVCFKFACVDGPEFDGHLVDFDQAMKRSQMYKTEEGRALLKLQEGDTHHGGCGHCGGDE